MTYSEQLHELARELVSPERFGDVALGDTIEFEPIVEAQILSFPEGIKLRNPPESGWEYTPPEAA
jgi:hypothetical protein